jgi:tetratricopeptide (TPR) repeat protein
VTTSFLDQTTVTAQSVRLFVSSPTDAADERRRVDFTVERLNTEFAGRIAIETIRWETRFYSAHESFLPQIPEAADCDLVIALFRGRLGSPVPDDFPKQANGEPYPSGTAYEVMSSIAARRSGRPLPDVYVFRYAHKPIITLDNEDNAEVETQWKRLKAFFDTWFKRQDGRFVAAFESYGSTDDFATRLDDCLRQWLAKRGFVAQGPVWDRIVNGSPFPGLAAFDENRRTVFFGRALAIQQTIERLREAGADSARLPFLLIIGASGSGKSSLLRAGILPSLALPGSIPEVDLWRMAVFTPGPDPFFALATALNGGSALGTELQGGAFADTVLLAKQMASDPTLALAPLREALAKAAEARRVTANYEAARLVRIALAVDQAERLFTEVEPDRAEAFAQLLLALAREGLACVVVVLRSDAYPRFQSSAMLLELRDKGATYDLTPPTPDELQHIVALPVAACAPPLAFEVRDGASLAARLVAEARGGDVLPLLQVTLARLYGEEEKRGDGLLRFDDYHGLEAAVSETADAAMARLGDPAKAELPKLVAGLVGDVGVDPVTGAPVPIVVPLDRVKFEAGRPARRALIDAFVEARLLTSEGGGEGARVRPVHESLLRIWPQAVEIVKENAGLIRVRRTLEPIVRDWSAAMGEAKAAHLHLSPPLLAGAQRLLERFGDDLSPPMRAFIGEALRRDEDKRVRDRVEQEERARVAEALAKARGRVAWAAGIGLIVALGLAAAAGWQWRRAETTLALATDAANEMVIDLAKSMRDRVGMPIDLVSSILSRAQRLQNKLIDSSGGRREVLLSEAEGLNEIVVTEFALGDTRGALAAAENFKSLLDTLAAKEPRNRDIQRLYSFSLNRIGDAQMHAGRYSDALASFDDSVALRRKLVNAEPHDSQARDDLAAAYEKLGEAQHALGGDDNNREAAATFDASLAIRKALVAEDPKNAGWRRDLGLSYERRGALLSDFGDDDEALESFATNLALREELARESPDDTQARRDLAIAWDFKGLALKRLGRLDEAITAFVNSLDLRKTLANSDPKNLEWRRDLAVGYAHCGDVYLENGDKAKALEQYHAALAIRAELASRDAANPLWQSDLALDLRRLGIGGEEPRANFERALGIARKLQAEKKLSSGLAGLPDDLERRLSTIEP